MISRVYLVSCLHVLSLVISCFYMFCRMLTLFELYATQKLKIDLYIHYFLKDISTGKSILFAPRLPAEYAVWLGKIKPLTYFKVID